MSRLETKDQLLLQMLPSNMLEESALKSLRQAFWMSLLLPFDLMRNWMVWRALPTLNNRQYFKYESLVLIMRGAMLRSIIKSDLLLSKLIYMVLFLPSDYSTIENQPVYSIKLNSSQVFNLDKLLFTTILFSLWSKPPHLL